MINSLSIDWEDWYQVPLAQVPLAEWKNCRPTVERTTDAILEFLSKHKITATFFVSGYCAERHPAVISAIAGAGHEVESHGYWHKLAYKQTPDQFTQDVVLSVDVIRAIIGRSPIGYRAPAWSTTRIIPHATKTLVEQGFRYDSSLFPTNNFLFGGAKLSTETTYRLADTELLEIPPTTLDIKIGRVPVTGGFYMRALPYCMFRKLLALRNCVGPAMIYFHPWEVANNYPRMPIPAVHRFVQYYRCGRMLDTLERLVGEFAFGSFQQVYPAINMSGQNTSSAVKMPCRSLANTPLSR
jgi:polysaccharide deacetylase family protein (PEP-CTERM system associated)